MLVFIFFYNLNFRPEVLGQEEKVRQFHHLKSLMFNVTVNSEPELLSLLTTSDIKAIGGEVLLTWGGPALASITHPEVCRSI